MTLATLQALTSFWSYAHRSHLGFIGVRGRRDVVIYFLEAPIGDDDDDDDDDDEDDDDDDDDNDDGSGSAFKSDAKMRVQKRCV